MDSVKPPSPWTATIIALCAVVLGCIVWPYIQMRHWKDPGVDYMVTATSIFITIILGLVLAWATYINLRDAHRAGRSEKALKDQAEQHTHGIALRDAAEEQLNAQLQVCISALDKERARRPRYVSSGAAKLLARQAGELTKQLGDLWASAQHSELTVPDYCCHPLSDFLTKTPQSEWAPLHWGISRFRENFGSHRSEVLFNLVDFKSDVTARNAPDMIQVDSLIVALDSHHSALVKRAASLLED